MISIDHLTFRYGSGTEPVLNDLSLRISAGESVCLMGANGSGKSTLARLVAGLLPSPEGSIRIDGRSAGTDDAPLVGILFQNPDNQMVAMVVEKEIAFALENQGLPMTEMLPRVDAVIESYAIEHLRNRLTSELSGGEKQRVALAAVMIQNPPVLVLDEPDSFLDEAGRSLLRKALAMLRERSPSLVELRVTQYPGVARRYPRLVVLNDGNVLADNDPENVLGDDTLCHRAGLAADYDLSGDEDRALALLSQEMRGGPGMVTMNNVTFGFDPHEPVLRDLDLRVPAGETLGIVGPSGSGKTTLGLLLCRLLKPQSGVVDFADPEGRPLMASPRRGSVAGVFQQPERQFFLDSCAEEVAFGPRNLGRHLTGAEIDRFLTLVGLEPLRFRERDPFSLSAGEKRRLAFAVVLAMRPAFVVFDEPTCALDPRGVGRFVALSQRFKASGAGQVIISHDGGVISRLTDRVVVCGSSGIDAEMTTAEFFASGKARGVVSEPG